MLHSHVNYGCIYVCMLCMYVYVCMYMQINGKHISWDHLVQLYKRKSSSGLSLLPKLTREHVYLNSYSRMRVNLAAQVRDSIAKSANYLISGCIISRS